MPLFVDHVGMNTIINDELDLNTNTRNVPARNEDFLNHQESRFSRTVSVAQNLDYVINAPSSTNDSRLYNENLNGWGLNNDGFALSFGVDLDNSDLVSKRYVFATTRTDGSEVFSLYFTGSRLHFDMVSGSNYVRTSASINMSNAMDYTSYQVKVFSTSSIFMYRGGGVNLSATSTSSGSLAMSDLTSNKLYLFDSSSAAATSELQGSLFDVQFFKTASFQGTDANNYRIDRYLLGNEPELTSSFVRGDQITSGTIILPSPFGSLPLSGNNSLTSSGNIFMAENSGYVHVSTYTYTIDGFVAEISESAKVAARNIHRNGPYGLPMWKQLRASQNPIIRNHKKNNKMTFVTQPGPTRNVLPDGELRVRDRYSALYSFTEPAICQKAYPLVWNVGRHFKDEDGNIDLQKPNKFSIVSSYGNSQIGFANEQVNKLLKYDPNQEDTEYESIKTMYLENGLNKQDSPLSYWEFLQYRETVFPKPQQQYIDQVHNRPQFESFFRHNRLDRVKFSKLPGPFGHQRDDNVGTLRSSWPLDEERYFLTRSYTSDKNSITWSSARDPDVIQNRGGSYIGRNGEGELLSTRTQFVSGLSGYVSNLTSDNPALISGSAAGLDNTMGPGPLYARRISLNNSQSVSNPFGMEIYGTSSTMKMFQGGALWEAGDKRQIKDADGNYVSAPKKPFYDTYENYVEEVRKYGKNYSIIPEFRMSEQIEDYRKTNGGVELDMFEVTGGISGSDNSSKRSFYDIYSNTDFMKNFEVIASDHEDFTNGKVLSLRCKAIKKFLPYEGFYPCQRTVDLTKRFYDSFKQNISLQNSSGSEIKDFNFGRQLVLAPLFAPGVLFNTIKSGVAVDYPVVTGSLIVANSGNISGYADHELSYFMNVDKFDYRIPFEAMVEPQRYLANITLTSNEPHPSGNLGVSSTWDGQGDELYALMANNFLSEVPEFFLRNKQFTSIVSKKQSDIVLVSGSIYGMRVKMRRSMDGPRPMSNNKDNVSLKYSPPQDLAPTTGSLVKETFTMYSRPSAFGPPTFGVNYYNGNPTGTDAIVGPNAAGRHIVTTDGGGNDPALIMDSFVGYNFPFTPPYYHGEGWCEIILTASANKMTIAEIQEQAKYHYTRFDALSNHFSSSVVRDIPNADFGPQAIRNINQNAVQLSASLNMKGIGRVTQTSRSGEPEKIVVDSGINEDSRWIIQTKFETPMLNFNHVSGSDHLSLPTYGSGSVPRGMWHQYGRIPEESEGVFLEVGPIEKNWRTQSHGQYYLPQNPEVLDLSEALGFNGASTKIGRLQESKKISEAVVAVPFVEDQGRRKFFRIDPEKVRLFKEGDLEALTQGDPSSQIGRSVLLQMNKMRKFIFPPSFDFLNFDDVDPIAMYIFEFTHTLTQQDLSDIWQNLPPDIGTEMEVSEVAITHPLLRKELLGQGGESGNATIEMPDKLKWMVFKVKQRAASNYFKKTVLRNPNVNTDTQSGNVTTDEFGDTSVVQYNWPYDFFSLVEMVKIDAEVEMGNIDFSNYTDVIPEWNAVIAEPEKIAEMLGGMEENPIPEVEAVEEQPEEPVASTGLPPVDVDGLFSKFKQLMQQKARTSRSNPFGGG